MVIHQELKFSTSGRGTFNISREIEQVIHQCGIDSGVCHLFIQHTSASLILCENADPAVRVDLETFMQKLVPDGDRMFRHQDEGPDDMPAHVRTILTQNALTLPIQKGRTRLGTWQGIYLWEHRTQPHKRRLIVTIIGE